MKKTVLASLMLLIICAFAAYLFLVYYFDERSFDILEETIYVLFTGCIFNISSTIIVLLFGWIRNSQKEYRLKFSLKKTLIEIDQRISNNIVNDIKDEMLWGKNIEMVMSFHKQFVSLYVNNYVIRKSHRDCLDQINGKTLDLATQMYSIQKMVTCCSSETAQHVEVEKKLLGEKINELLKLIS